jgi:hypothetical protein
LGRRRGCENKAEANCQQILHRTHSLSELQREQNRAVPETLQFGALLLTLGGYMGETTGVDRLSMVRHSPTAITASE